MRASRDRGPDVRSAVKTSNRTPLSTTVITTVHVAAQFPNHLVRRTSRPQDAPHRSDGIHRTHLLRDETTVLLFEVEDLTGPDPQAIAESLGDGDLPLLGYHTVHTIRVVIPT
jgi:hypothetical protein